MDRILVVFTGGTIGSRVSNSIIDVDESTGYYLLNLFDKNVDMDVNFDVIQPINILSENYTPEHWQLLYQSLRKVDMVDYKGIIITHGTDTLPYTSAIISFLFNYTSIPIVITGSNFALDDEKSNGLDNFTNSVYFIINNGLPGIYTIYQNSSGENIVYLGTRLREADSYHDQFHSYGNVNLGQIKDGVFLMHANKINPTKDIILNAREKLLDEEVRFTNTILAIKPYPGLDYNFFDLDNYRPKAILHSLYHSGTGCIKEGVYSLPGFISKCKDKQIPIYLMSFKNINKELYITSCELLQKGVIPLQNITFEAACAKLNIAYNQSEYDPVEYMKKELFFEYLPL